MNPRIVLAFAYSWGALFLCSGASLTLTPTRDTSLFQTVSNNNVGGAQTLAAGGTDSRGPVRMLMRFDPSSIPVGSVVTNTTLDLTVVMAPMPATASTFALHRLLVDWGEGVGGAGILFETGRTASNGEASWNNRFHPSTPWSSPGGRAGVDYVATPSATASVNLGSSRFLSTPEMIEDVQGWIENPTANFGWIVLSQSETTSRTARRFGSREHLTPGTRPTLIIQHGPFQIENVTLAGNQLAFDFPGQKGAVYQIQVKEDPATLPWETFSNVGPLESGELTRVLVPMNKPQGFYRLKRLPLIAAQPVTQLVTPGSNAVFSVLAIPTNGLTYQWLFNGNVIAHATNATLTVTNADGGDVGDYSVMVLSGADSVLSQTAELRLRIAPVIVQQPQSQTASVGSTVSFTVVVTNNATLPIYYRWRKGSTTLSLQVRQSRESTFTISNVQASAAGLNYNVVITNSVSFTPGILSSNAALTVTNP